MSAYRPLEPADVLAMVALLAAIILAGFGTAGKTALARAILFLVAGRQRRRSSRAVECTRTRWLSYARNHRRLALRDEGSRLDRGSGSRSAAALDRPLARLRRALAWDAARSVRQQ